MSHGLPLNLADRKAAAVRILQAHPGWSDRAIATVAGLSPVTVRTLRECATGNPGQLPTRLGRDGRLRPLDAGGGGRPGCWSSARTPSLREVARSAGVSVGTVRDVLRRLWNGEDLVPRAGRPRAWARIAGELRAPGPPAGEPSGSSG